MSTTNVPQRQEVERKRLSVSTVFRASFVTSVVFVTIYMVYTILTT